MVHAHAGGKARVAPSRACASLPSVHPLLLTGLVLAAADGGVDSVHLGSLRWRLPAGSSATHQAPRVTEDGPWGPATEESFHLTRPDGATLRLVRLVPKRPPRWPAKESDVLDAWRRFHGCTTRPAKTRAPLGQGPQLTFTGGCKGGDSYALRVLRLEEPDGTASLYELHADRGVMVKGPPLEDVLDELAASVELRACAPSAFFDAARSDGGVRADLDGDGKEDALRVTLEGAGSGFSTTEVELRLSSRRAPFTLALGQPFTAFLSAVAVPPELEGPARAKVRGALAGAFERVVCRAADPSLEWLLSPGLRWKPGRPQLPDTSVLSTTDPAARARAQELLAFPALPSEVLLSYLGANHARGDAPPFRVLDRREGLELLGTAHGVVLYDVTLHRHAWLYVHEGGEKLRWPSIVGASFVGKDVVVRTRVPDGKANETRVDLSTGVPRR